MKNLYILFFLVLFGCSSNSKVYICGDHPCKDKNEIEDYFKNNISMEVYVIENDKLKKKNQDLVNLNMSNSNQKKNKENLAFLEKRKQNDVNKKDNQKPLKLKLQVRTDIDNKPKKNKNQVLEDVSKKKFAYKKTKSTKFVHMCKKVEECDIDIISERISDLNKKKSFPDINF
tara:strand:+ start:295 stop:813 length:519 start_codon:yes stop_codon:yes gene_type:complete